MSGNMSLMRNRVPVDEPGVSRCRARSMPVKSDPAVRWPAWLISRPSRRTVRQVPNRRPPGQSLLFSAMATRVIRSNQKRNCCVFQSRSELDGTHGRGVWRIATVSGDRTANKVMQ